MASVSETDDEGRFRLENIPPGQYYIVAGRLDLPTFYPGTLDLSSGTAIKIAAGETRAGMDFTLKESSVRSLYLDASNAMTTVGAYIRVVGTGGKFPVTRVSARRRRIQPYAGWTCPGGSCYGAPR